MLIANATPFHSLHRYEWASYYSNRQPFRIIHTKMRFYRGCCLLLAVYCFLPGASTVHTCGSPKYSSAFVSMRRIPVQVQNEILRCFVVWLRFHWRAAPASGGKCLECVSLRTQCTKNHSGRRCRHFHSFPMCLQPSTAEKWGKNRLHPWQRQIKWNGKIWRRTTNALQFNPVFIFIFYYRRTIWLSRRHSTKNGERCSSDYTQNG